MSKTLEEIITSPSLVRENWLPTELAVREVLAFERRFGSKHLKLACHAALPLILSPELVNLIHLNFLEGEGIPWVAEVDLLLSPLCRPVDEGLYEVEPAIREVLLVELENQFSWERPFELANFLQFYLANKTGLKLRPEIIQTQRWIAQAYIDPDKLVEALNNWLESSLSQEDNRLGLPEQIQLITSLELLAEPLELTNQLTEYQKIANNSRVLAQILYGDEQALRRKIWQEQVDGEIVDIQSMQISSTILMQLMSRNETLTESEDIYRYQKALEVYTFEEFPEQWATTQVQLAVAYLDFISVNRAEHLEQAIFAFEAALQVRTREDFPAHWAEIQNYLGLTYKERIRGEKAENLERAIACCLEAFQVFTLEAFPEDWAKSQNTLGSI
jgi:tetratricopeptide (TPR) repeat protein